jgi:GAF domain-containing protein
VDLLCNDLITAYGELAKELDAVRTQEGFRKHLAKAKDLEQLLCHTMDWLLRQMGYCNVAIWLAADDSDFQLGAYMKYTIAGEQDLTDALKKGLIPLTLKQGLLHLSGDEVQGNLTPQELDYLADQSILSINCTYLAEPLAVVLLFRDAKDAFTDEDEAVLKQISPIFAVALAEIVKAGQTYQTDDNPFYGGNEESPKSEKRDPADWWKRGETPPF